jgi:hypothetical protein
VTTGFGALRHDDVGPQVDRAPGLLEIGDLDDQHRARSADGFDEAARVAEGQHDGARPVLQRALDRTGIDRPGQEADTPRPVGAGGEDRHLAVQPLPVAVPGAQHPEPATPGDGRRQRSPGRAAHRRQHDRMPHPEQRRESRRQRHHPIIATGRPGAQNSDRSGGIGHGRWRLPRS